MYCKQCGALINDTCTVCPHCGTPVNTASTVNNVYYQNQVCPQTHLVKAIILTILCCWPLGIPAIVYAAGVDSAFRGGNYSLALERSQKAGKWCNVTLIVGIILGALYLILIIVLIATGAIADLL